MLDLFLEAMPRPHIAKQHIAYLSGLVLFEPVHRRPPRCGRAGSCAGRVKAAFKSAPLELFWCRPARYTEPSSRTAFTFEHAARACRSARQRDQTSNSEVGSSATHQKFGTPVGFTM